ncbi:hypothetical protein IKD56_00835 [bacterium]|nr:hypothetical protein [bacterium]
MKISKKVLRANGKLTFKHIKGGVLLVPTDFTIKDDSIKRSIEKFEK